MNRELKVYNRFEELIAHLKLVPGDPIPLRIEDGTPELRRAIKNLIGRDFDQTVISGGQWTRFEAPWGSPEYLDALAGYWSSNFGWQTRLVETDSNWGQLLTRCATADFISNIQTLETYQQTAECSFAINHAFPVGCWNNLKSSSHQYVTAAEAFSWVDVENNLIASTYNLFDTQIRPASVYSFLPTYVTLESVAYPQGGFSLGYGVRHPTAVARLEENNPNLQPIFSMKNSEVQVEQ